MGKEQGTFAGYKGVFAPGKAGMPALRQSGIAGLWGKNILVDLSPELVPGKEDRRLAIREYIFDLDNTYMHDIDMMSHIGAHIEAPSHYKKNLTDVSRLPLSSFIGEAVRLNVKNVGKARPILPEHIKKISKTGVKKNDILILYSPYFGKDWMACSHCSLTCGVCTNW